MGKGLAIGFVIAGIFIGIARLVRNTRSKMQGKQLLKLIDQDPNVAADVAAELLNVYATTPHNGQPLRVLLQGLTETQTYGKFQILRKVELGTGDFLVLTLCRSEDYDMGVNGKMKNVDRVTQYNFAIRLNREKQQVEVCSEYFFDLSDKFLRQEFGEVVVGVLNK